MGYKLVNNQSKILEISARLSQGCNYHVAGQFFLFSSTLKAWENNFWSGGDNNKAAIISWLADPKPEAEAKPKETEWSEEESEVRNYQILLK